MPFFRFLSSQQITNSCQEKSLDKLKTLNHDYLALFETINENEIKINNKINLITQQITDLTFQIEASKSYRQRAQEFRQHLLDNLPEDPAERHLAQKSAFNIYDNEPLLQQKKRKLEKEKEGLIERQNSLTRELHDCVQELKIVNAVIEQKEIALKTTKVSSQFK